MNRIAFLALSIILLFAVSKSVAKEVDLRERIFNAQPGQWVKMKSPGGVETTTLISKKDSQFISVEIHTFRKGKPQSWVEQVYRLSDQEIIRCRVKYPDGFIEEIPVNQVSLWVDIFRNKQYRFVQTEPVKVPAGEFEADHYRTIVEDNLVHLWLSSNIPVTGLVKSRFRGGSSELLEYGIKGIDPEFQ